MSTGWIGVDLDGTLAYWGGGYPADVLRIGPPIPLMVARVKDWLADGEDVRIVTARVGPASEEECHAALMGLGDARCSKHPHYNAATHDPVEYFLADQRKLIEGWCSNYLGVILPITATKDFHMRVLYDDRAREVVTNEGTLVSETLGLV